jgi:hypothetical protein
MLIRRCAWHRLYNGYPMLYGVAAWREHGVQYTDGMCRRCAVIALREWRKGEGAPPPRPAHGWLRPHARRAAIAVAAASLLVALGLTAALRDGGGRDAGSSALPRAATGAGPATPREICVDPSQETGPSRPSASPAQPR